MDEKIQAAAATTTSDKGEEKKKEFTEEEQAKAEAFKNKGNELFKCKQKYLVKI